eukprot:TRINITY_DN2258_c0_g2_i1.p1 TRINITY_DN2258_c0_g2~~TRINITY_DN2258_c0_g2_i1.p1  ORF type:complete len:665 (-),score=168.23 TRINITY_DN2258_c0_g2_i1:69-2063(-)
MLSRSPRLRCLQLLVALVLSALRCSSLESKPPLRLLQASPQEAIRAVSSLRDWSDPTSIAGAGQDVDKPGWEGRPPTDAERNPELTLASLSQVLQGSSPTSDAASPPAAAAPPAEAARGEDAQSRPPRDPELTLASLSQVLQGPSPASDAASPPAAAAPAAAEAARVEGAAEDAESRQPTVAEMDPELTLASLSKVLQGPSPASDAESSPAAVSTLAMPAAPAEAPAEPSESRQPNDAEKDPELTLASLSKVLQGPSPAGDAASSPAAVSTLAMPAAPAEALAEASEARQPADVKDDPGDDWPQLTLASLSKVLQGPTPGGGDAEAGAETGPAAAAASTALRRPAATTEDIAESWPQFTLSALSRVLQGSTPGVDDAARRPAGEEPTSAAATNVDPAKALVDTSSASKAIRLVHSLKDWAMPPTTPSPSSRPQESGDPFLKGESAAEFLDSDTAAIANAAAALDSGSAGDASDSGFSSLAGRRGGPAGPSASSKWGRSWRLASGWNAQSGEEVGDGEVELEVDVPADSPAKDRDGFDPLDLAAEAIFAPGGSLLPRGRAVRALRKRLNLGSSVQAPPLSPQVASELLRPPSRAEAFVNLALEWRLVLLCGLVAVLLAGGLAAWFAASGALGGEGNAAALLGFSASGAKAASSAPAGSELKANLA